jgi:hypothetical protein
MDLRKKITTLLSVCLRGAGCEVRVAPVANSVLSIFRAYAFGTYPGIGEVSSYGMTEAYALDGLWESVQREARRSVAMAESTLETVQRTRDSAARNAQELTDRLASLRMAMRSTGANPRDPGLLHAAPSPPSAPTRLKIAALWGWCFDHTGTVQTEETVRDGKPWRHAWVDHDGHLATRGYGATDDDALADLWQRVQREADAARVAREERLAMCRQRILEAQGTERDIVASLAQIDRIMAKETGS